MTTTPPAKRQPVPFGKYLLLDRINIGGMAEVWRAKTFGAGGFEKLVAIKRILPNIAEDDEFISMFIDEAKISSQLNHANVAQIDSLGQINNSYYIAMEYIAGKDMRAIFDRSRKKGEPAPVPLSCYVVAKLCEGLDYAHRKKDGMGKDLHIVHRDVSPQNVLISYEGEVKVIDFGIAKAAGKATKTQAGILKGKFGYMSPEQIRGLPLDRRSDVFAIGVCLYEMLTGERLFVGDSDFAVLEKVRKAEVPPPSTFNKRIPEALEKIVLKALAKDVENRYQYANELSDDLQRFLITSEAIFSRKDLMAYMKATFAEEVEKEKARLQEYSEIKAPEGMLAAAELGFGTPAAPSPATTPSSAPVLSAKPTPRMTNPGTIPQVRPTLSSPNIPAVKPTLSSPNIPAVKPTLSSPNIPQVKPAGPAPSVLPEIRRSPSLVALPKLTAAAPVHTANEEGGATMLVDGAELRDEPHGLDQPEPTVLGVAPTAAAPQLTRSLPPAAPAAEEETPEKTRIGFSLDGHGDALAVEDVAPQHSRDVIPGGLGGNETRVTALPTPPPDEEELEELESPATEIASALPSKPARRPQARPARSGERQKTYLLAAGAIVLVAAASFFAFGRGPKLGVVNVEVEGYSGPATLNINGERSTLQRTDLRKVAVGQAMVLVTADGYEPFKDTIVVSEQPVTVKVRLEKTQRSTQLVVVPEPLAAEIRVDGKLAKAEGQSGVYLGELQTEGAHDVEVRLAGYQVYREQVSAQGGQLQVAAKLKPMEFPLSVFSDPSGAAITIEGKSFGVTPQVVRVYPSTKAITFTLRCHEPRVVPVHLPASPSQEPLPVRANLKKIRGCR